MSATARTLLPDETMQDSVEAQFTTRQAPSGGCVLEARELHKRFETAGTPVHALRGVCVTVGKGEFVVIMGASGSGKSTLLHLLGLLDTPTSGSIWIEGKDLGRMNDRQRTLFRRLRLGIVFQAYNLLPTLSAAENIALPAILDGADDHETMKRTQRLLEQVDLSHRSDHRPQALSGGEQQRVAIARALMNDPAMVLADEPTGNLDTEHGTAIWRLLASLVHDQGRSVLAVTHEADGAAFADRVIVLRDGRVAGEFQPGGEDNASIVASRYRELVG